MLISTPVGQFRSTNEGIWFVVDGKDTYVAPQIEVSSYTRNIDGGDWGRILEWYDPDGKKQTLVASPQLLSDQADLKRRLIAGGFRPPMEPLAWQRLLKFLHWSDPKDRKVIPTSYGWQSNLVFVLPDEIIGSEVETKDILLPSRSSEVTLTRGSLANWQREVAAVCEGHSRLVFAICVALAPTILRFTQEFNCGFHFRGPSSTGKTTALRVAASVWGPPQGENSYLSTWRATSNGLEGVANLRNDSLMALDELNQISPKEVGATAYMLANGIGKARANTDGDARKQRRWRLLFLSTGEVSLETHLAANGEKIRAGQEVRWLDIPVNLEHGIFGPIPCGTSAEMLSRHLVSASNQNYGTPVRHFLNGLMRQTQDIQTEIEVIAKALARNIPLGASGQIFRAVRSYALVASAGVLGVRSGTLPWTEHRVLEAVHDCLNGWLENRNTTDNFDTAVLISQVRLFLERHGESSFTWIAHDGTLVTEARSSRAGFRVEAPSGGGNFEYYIFPQTMTDLVIKGFDKKWALNTLAEKGIIKKDSSGRNSIPRHFRGVAQKSRYYVVSSVCDASIESDFPST